MTDSSWFYSSLSQVTAAIVGFFGGFFILRLLNYTGEWRQLRSRLESTQSAWILQERSTEDVESSHLDTLERQAKVDADRLWLDLKRAIDARRLAKMPRELLWGALLLGVLLLVGSVWPLLVLGGPSNSQQLGFLVPWVIVLAAFGLLMYFQARASLNELKSLKLADRTEGQYEEDALQEEAWAAQQAWWEEEQRKKKERPSAPEEPSA